MGIWHIKDELRARLMSWVLRVATNLWRDRLRGRQDYPLTRDIEDPGTRDAPERRETVLEVSRRLDQVRMPSDRMLILFIHAVSFANSAASMAKALDCAPGAGRPALSGSPAPRCRRFRTGIVSAGLYGRFGGYRRRVWDSPG